jgi:UDP-glucose 6-dehydrogenase
VYVEKPVGHTIQEGRAMVNAARDAQRVVQVGTHRRTSPHNMSGIQFLREGNAVRDVFQPSRIVLGSDDQCAAQAVAELYRALNAPLLITDTRTAEMIKYASNAILATRISFVNEIAQICERVAADVTVVSEGMGHDPRIGPLFLDAGIGFGGSCFPKDVKALAYMAAEAGCHPQLLNAVLEINQDQRRRFVHKLQDILEDLADSVFSQTLTAASESGMVGQGFAEAVMQEPPVGEVDPYLSHEFAFARDALEVGDEQELGDDNRIY